MDKNQWSEYLLSPNPIVTRWPEEHVVVQASVGWNETKDFASRMYDNPGIMLEFLKSDVGILCMIVAAILLVGWLFIRSSNRTNKFKGEDKAMREWQRKREIQTILGDIWTEVVETARFKDLLSKGEKRDVYKRLAKLYETDDFVPQHPGRVKAKIRRRLEAMRSQPKPKLPGDQPSELKVSKTDAPKTPPKRIRNMISSVMSSKQATA